MQSCCNDDLSITFRDVGVFYPQMGKFRARKTSHNGFWALKSVSFELNKGDVLGVVGGNGAGKTTALSVIAGILEPDKGHVNTYGLRATLLSLGAGFVPYLSGEKNIMLLGLTLGISRKQIEESLKEIIDYSELGEFIQKPVETYSSGMKARLGFSTALVLQPDILLIDEVLGVGDKNFRKKSKESIQNRLKKASVTAVIVSHSASLVKDVCSKALLIEHGKSVAFGDVPSVMKLYEKS